MESDKSVFANLLPLICEKALGMEISVKEIAIVLAGGKGSRMNSSTPKQYLVINGYPVLYYSLKAFQESSVDEIILVAGRGETQLCRREIVNRYGFDKVSAIAEGGAERYDSVMSALKVVKERVNENDLKDVTVYIHDGARPCVSDIILKNCREAVRKFGACTAAVPVKDTIKIADENGFAVSTPDRNTLWQIQTPQVFKYDIIAEAYNKMYADTDRGNITDDAMLVERYTEIPVKMAMGAYSNIKITTPEDMQIAQMYLKKNM